MVRLRRRSPTYMSTIRTIGRLPRRRGRPMLCSCPPCRTSTAVHSPSTDRRSRRAAGRRSAAWLASSVPHALMEFATLIARRDQSRHRCRITSRSLGSAYGHSSFGGCCVRRPRSHGPGAAGPCPGPDPGRTPAALARRPRCTLERPADRQQPTSSAVWQPSARRSPGSAVRAGRCLPYHERRQRTGSDVSPPEAAGLALRDIEALGWAARRDAVDRAGQASRGIFATNDGGRHLDAAPSRTTTRTRSTTAWRSRRTARDSR